MIGFPCCVLGLVSILVGFCARDNASLLYRGMNLGISTTTQKKTKAITMAQMKTKGHVVAKLQQFTLR